VLELFFDTAEWTKMSSPDEYNEQGVEGVDTIACRKVYSSEVVVTENNEHKLSEVKVYVSQDVGLNDLIDGKPILKIVELKSLLNNQIYGYKLLL
jgi:hypothetical protein